MRQTSPARRLPTYLWTLAALVTGILLGGAWPLSLVTLTRTTTVNPERRDFTREMLNDEGVNGTVHIGVGTSSTLGGVVQAKTHFDAVIRRPTVRLDDGIVIRDGAVLVEES